jgi:hypothetical protein
MQQQPENARANIGPMSDPPSPAERVANLLRDIVPFGVTFKHPDADVTWSLRPNPRPGSLARFDELQQFVRATAPVRGVAIAIEGLCRVRIGNERTGEKFTAAVVHVIADGEPVRTVLLPIEETE